MCVDGCIDMCIKHTHSYLNWYFVKLILMEVLVSIVDSHIQTFSFCLMLAI